MSNGLIVEFCCPACGEDTESLHEGYCHPCFEEREKELMLHNARWDWWNTLSSAERERNILWAMN